MLDNRDIRKLIVFREGLSLVTTEYKVKKEKALDECVDKILVLLEENAK